MGRSFIKTSSSHKKAYVGFLPIPEPSASIVTASGTTIVPAVLSLEGVWNKGDIINVEITTSVPVTTNTITSSQVPQDSHSFAKLVAIDLSLETNITAVAVGANIEILASGAGTTVLIDSIVVN